ncbi:uncharacterized protein PHACADRAFT_259020, partial [Phanerochaete carnosa HHB-10118-sp]
MDLRRSRHRGCSSYLVRFARIFWPITSTSTSAAFIFGAADEITDGRDEWRDTDWDKTVPAAARIELSKRANVVEEIKYSRL